MNQETLKPSLFLLTLIYSTILLHFHPFLLPLYCSSNSTIKSTQKPTNFANYSNHNRKLHLYKKKISEIKRKGRDRNSEGNLRPYERTYLINLLSPHFLISQMDYNGPHCGPLVTRRKQRTSFRSLRCSAPLILLLFGQTLFIFIFF